MDRCDRIQHRLRSGGWDCNNRQVSAVLLALGIDARFSEGCSRLFEWLCGGNPLSSRPESENIEEVEDMEDVIILITSDSVHLYCNPINSNALLQVLGKINNLQLHCLNTELYKDSDFAQEFKVKTFIQMTAPHAVVGVPYFAVHDPSQSFDPMKLESEWPIVMSYAAEELGGHGFFTLGHEVVELSPYLEEVYAELDPSSLRDMVDKSLTGFQKQFQAMFTLLDSSRPDGIAALNEKQLAEAFILYARHRESLGPSHVESLPSGVWLGCGSAAMAEGRWEGTSVVGSSGPQHSSAIHMVCNLAGDPLSAKRSYFLCHPHSHQSDPALTAELPSEKDIRLLQDLYSCLVTAVNVGISTFQKTQRPSEALRAVRECLKEQSTSRGLPLPGGFWDSRENLLIHLRELDICGRPLPTKEAVWSPTVKQLSVYLQNIPSCSDPEQCLGALAMGESFVDSVIAVDTGLDTQCLILTSDVPAVVSWPASRQDMATQKRKLESKESPTGDWGGHVTSLSPVFLTPLTRGEVHTVSVHLHLYQRALVLENPHFGLAELPWEAVHSLLFIDKDSPPSPATIVVDHAPSLPLPPELTNLHSQGTLFFTFAPYYQTAWRALYQQVIPFLHSLDKIETPEELPPTTEQIHTQLQQLFAEVPVHSPPFGVPCNVGMKLESFLKHFEVACALKDKGPMDSVTLQHIMFPETATAYKGSPQTKLVVTIVTGIPGSHQEGVCSSLLAEEHEGTRWVVLNQPFHNTSDFSAKNLQESLSTLVANLRRKGIQRRSLTGFRKSRILLVTPWFSSVATVLKAISNHPDETVTKYLKIGNVIGCCSHTHIWGRTPFPGLLQNCAAGLVSTVVFTGVPGQSDYTEQLKEVRHMMHSCNPAATLLTAPAGKVTSKADLAILLDEQAWGRGEILRERVLRHRWVGGEGEDTPTNPQPKFDLVCLRFQVPLSSEKLESWLKALKPVTSPDEAHSKEGLLYHLRASVVLEGRSSLSEVYFTRQSGYLSITDADPQPSQQQESCVVFVGLGLGEGPLKASLNACRGESSKILPLRSRDTLSSEELATLKAKCHNSPLPDGYYYTGQFYVSFDGDKSLEHPLLDQLIEDFLTEKNEEIVEHNTRVGSKVMFP